MFEYKEHEDRFLIIHSRTQKVIAVVFNEVSAKEVVKTLNTNRVITPGTFEPSTDKILFREE